MKVRTLHGLVRECVLHCVIVVCLAAGCCVFSTPLFAQADPDLRVQNDDGAAASLTAPAATQSAAMHFPQLMTALNSPEFIVRQKAVTELQNADAGQLTALSELLLAESNAEVSQRFVDVLENLFSSRDERSKAASDILERCAQSERWVIAEQAGSVLDRNWRRRIEHAVAELRTLGVGATPKDISAVWQDGGEQLNAAIIMGGNRRGMFPGGSISTNTLRLFIDDNWKDGERGMELLSRLSAMGGIVSIFLIDGHAMSDDHVAALKAKFGANTLQERGKVCLGISWLGVFQGTSGCMVRDVVEGGSAADAGIVPNDLITGLNGKEIKDFDTLVTMLREFDVGSKVIMNVQRGVDSRFQGRNFPPGFLPPGQTETLEIEVTLKGWY